MKAIATLAAAAALLALTACDRLGIGAGAGNETANATANGTGESGKDEGGGNGAQAGLGGKDPAGAVQASAGAPVLDRNYITGRWTDNGDCSLAAEFMPDGRFLANNGNEGLWHIAGDRLTMQGERTLTLQIVPIDQDTMNVVNPDGSLGRSTRC